MTIAEPRLAGKTAIITGGARGMGAATARLFVSQGAQLVVTDIIADEGQAVTDALGQNAIFVRHDVSDEDQWQQVLDTALSRFRRVDILVNNAGVLEFSGMLETSKERFARILEINVIGTFLGIKTIAPAMIRGGGGSIVNISSIDGMKATNGAGAYVASKWGVRGLTKVAAMELGHHGVRVNSVHPGGINTPMTNPTGISTSTFDSIYSDIPMQRAGTALEVAHATLFLASDESSYCCGAEILVDGGVITGKYYGSLPGAPPGMAATAGNPALTPRSDDR